MIGKKNPVKIGRGLSANQMFYATNDTNNRQQRYSYFLSGNLNLSLYGWSVPLSFMYSNQNYSFQQPFNQYSIHPKYKWITAHIGYTSMNYTSYKLRGHLFLGAGVDLSPPGRFKVSLMFGRLNKKIGYDSIQETPVYERWGYGVKAGVNLPTGKNIPANVEVVVFHAADKAGSLPMLPDSILTPQENLVVAITGRCSVYKNFQFSGEIATSGVTRNTASDIKINSSRGLMGRLGGFFHTNNTTEFYSAKKINATYSGTFYSVGLGYKRIDPGYQTFGFYYFNNDLENITVNGSIRLLKNKLTFTGNVGAQHDDLNKQKISEMKRLVSSINATYAPTKKLNLNLSYSDFQSYMNIRSQFQTINQLTPYQNLDTLNYTQLSQSASASVNYLLHSDKRIREILNFNLNFQQAGETQQKTQVTPDSRFFNISSNYCYTFVPWNFTITSSLNANINDAPGNSSTTIRPTIAVNKLLLSKKLRSTLSYSYNNSYLNNTLINTVNNLRIMGAYQFLKKNNVNLSLVLMSRRLNIHEPNAQKLIELNGTIGYSYNF